MEELEGGGEGEVDGGVPARLESMMLGGHQFFTGLQRQEEGVRGDAWVLPEAVDQAGEENGENQEGAKPEGERANGGGGCTGCAYLYLTETQEEGQEECSAESTGGFVVDET